jgi:hypothetical protein
MNRNVLVGGVAGVVVVVAAALIYFLALGGGSTTPGGGGSSNALAKERAAIFWAGLKKVPGAQLTPGTASAGSGKESLVMRNYVLTLDGAKMGGKAGKITVKFGEINIRKLDWAGQKKGAAPLWADMTFKNITLPKDSLPPQAQMGLGMVGINEINLGGTYVYAYDKATKTFDMSKVVLDLKDLASLSFNAKLINFDITALARNQGGDPQKRAMAMQAAAAAASVGNLKIVLINKGLAKKLFTTLATFRGGNVEKFKAGLVAQLEAQKAAVPFNIAKEALTAAIAFIKNPKSLVIEAKPAKPVLIADVIKAAQADPNKIKELLNLTIIAK